MSNNLPDVYENLEFQEIIDDSNPRAVINLVPYRIKETISDLYRNNSNLTDLTEQEFLTHHKTSKTMDAIRLSFWNEYNRAQDTNKSMVAKNIYGPVISADTFYKKFLPKPMNVAWMLIPPIRYLTSMETSLHHGLDAVRDIISANRFNEDGTLNVAVAKLALQAFQLIDNRIHGSAIQRIEQKTATISMTSPAQEISGDQEALRKELEELRANSTTIEIEANEE